MSDIPMEVDDIELNIRRQGFFGLFEDSPLLNSGRLVFNSSHGLPGLTLQAQLPPQQPQDHSQSPQHDISVFQNTLDPQQSAMWTLNGDQTNQPENNQGTTWAQWKQKPLPAPAPAPEILQINPTFSSFIDPKPAQFFFSGPAPGNWYTHQQYSNTVSSNGQYSGPTSPNYSTSSSRQIVPTLSQPTGSYYNKEIGPASQIYLQQASVHPQFPQEISSSLSSHWSTAVQPVERDVPDLRRSSTLQSEMYGPSSSHPNFIRDFHQKLTAPSGSIPETVGMPPYVCNHCHKPGHIIDDCLQRKAKGRTGYVGDKLSNARFSCKNELCKKEYEAQVFPRTTQACPYCGRENDYTKMWKIQKNSFGQQEFHL